MPCARRRAPRRAPRPAPPDRCRRREPRFPARRRWRGRVRQSVSFAAGSFDVKVAAYHRDDVRGASVSPICAFDVKLARRARPESTAPHRRLRLISASRISFKEMTLFLRNAWYVAAWDHEVTRELRAVRIIGDGVVLYRTEAGDPVALEDACPHRKLPLSMGRLVGDELECGYHGMVFDRAGSCTRIPGVKRVPPSVCVRGYPAVSRYGLVWVWMGDPRQA